MHLTSDVVTPPECFFLSAIAWLYRRFCNSPWILRSFSLFLWQMIFWTNAIGDCIASVDGFWQYRHCHSIKSFHPWAWAVLQPLSSSTFVNFIFVHFEAFGHSSLSLPSLHLTQSYISGGIMNEICLTSFSRYLFLCIGKIMIFVC